MREINSGGRERCRESREFRGKPLKSLDLRAVLRPRQPSDQGKSREYRGSLCSGAPMRLELPLFNFHKRFSASSSAKRSRAVAGYSKLAFRPRGHFDGNKRLSQWLEAEFLDAQTARLRRHLRPNLLTFPASKFSLTFMNPNPRRRNPTSTWWGLRCHAMAHLRIQFP